MIIFMGVAGGVVEATCPYQCNSDKYHMPNCYTMLEDLVYTLGGPWLFTLLLSVVMFVLAMVLSVARMKLVGNDDFTGPAPASTPHGALIDHSYPFLESLNEVGLDTYLLIDLVVVATTVVRNSTCEV